MGCAANVTFLIYSLKQFETEVRVVNNSIEFSSDGIGEFLLDKCTELRVNSGKLWRQVDQSHL